MIARASLAFGVALCFGAASPDTAPLAAMSDDVVLVGDAKGIPLERLIELARDATGDAFLYEPRDVDEKVVFLGTVRVPRARFLEFFETCLRIEDYVVLDAKTPELRVHTIRKLGQQARGQQPLKSQARVVTLEELAQLRDRSVLITTTCTFHHIPREGVRDLICQYTTDSSMESMRCIDGTQILVVTGCAREIAALLDLARRLDEEIGRRGNHVVRFDLADRVATLEHQLAQVLREEPTPDRR